MAGWGRTLFLFSIFEFYVVNTKIILNSTGKLMEPPRNSFSFCDELQPKTLTAGEKNYLLWFHRALRDNVSKQVSKNLPKAIFMKNIKWHNALAEIARKWAFRCSNAKDDEPGSADICVTTLIENSDKVNLRDFLRVWKAGLSQLTPDIIAKYRRPSWHDYDYEHLTQILWWKTEFFGCGRSVYKQNCLNGNCFERKTVVKMVCKYSPEGNRPGEPVYLSGENKNLLCNYEPENDYCTSEEYNKTKEEILARSIREQEERERAEVEYRTRNRMIELWPAVGSQVNAWLTSDIKIFLSCVALKILPYLNKFLITQN